MRKIDTDTQEKILNLIHETIPHGSGIDGKWEIEFKEDYRIICWNDIHKMNDGGYYCGYSKLQVKIDPFTMECRAHTPTKDYQDWIVQTFDIWFCDVIRPKLIGLMGHRPFTINEQKEIQAGLSRARAVLVNTNYGGYYNWPGTFKVVSDYLNQVSMYVERFTQKEST